MHKLIKHLATLIHKKNNKTPSPLFLSSLSYTPTEISTEHLNIEHLVSKIKLRSYKGYLIFNTLDLSPLNISILYVLTNISRPILNIPLKKIALGFTNNINIYKDIIDVHIYNILEIIHNNTLLYLSIKEEYNNYNMSINKYISNDMYINKYISNDMYINKVNNDMSINKYISNDMYINKNINNDTINDTINKEYSIKDYEKRVIEQGNDVLDFYIGMYDIYLRMKYMKEDKKEIKNIKKDLKLPEEIRLEIHKYLKIFKMIFLTERSDFLENLFYNFKQIKKMSKMSYIYILQETIRSTFNYKIDLEIILNDSSSNNFNLFMNVPCHIENILTKEYILKLSNIFKFMYKLKKVEYLCRRKKNIMFNRLISKIYFYICEEVFNTYVLEVNGDSEDIKRILDENIVNILNRMYLDDNMFYKVIKELENILVRSLVEGIKFSDEYVKDLLGEMYKKTENEIFLI